MQRRFPIRGAHLPRRLRALAYRVAFAAKSLSRFSDDRTCSFIADCQPNKSRRLNSSLQRMLNFVGAPSAPQCEDTRRLLAARVKQTCRCGQVVAPLMLVLAGPCWSAWVVFPSSLALSWPCRWCLSLVLAGPCWSALLFRGRSKCLLVSVVGCALLHVVSGVCVRGRVHGRVVGGSGMAGTRTSLSAPPRNATGAVNIHHDVTREGQRRAQSSSRSTGEGNL